MRPEEHRSIGSTGVTVSALGLGTAALGGLYEPATDQDAVSTIEHALDAGISYFDTAPIYTFGLAERRAGIALRTQSHDGFTLATKVGRLLVPLPPGEVNTPVWKPALRPVWDFSRDGVHRSLDESLRRLQLDRVDIAYLHDPVDHEDEVYATGYPALAELRSQGVVRAIGAAMNESDMLSRFVERLDLDVVLCAGRYTLLDQDALSKLLPICRENGTAVVIGGVYNSGILADPGSGARFDYRPAAPALIDRARTLAGVCARYQVPLKAAAIQFPAAHPAVVSVLSGSRSPSELAENVDLFQLPIPDQLWQDLKDECLLPQQAPTPQASGVPGV